MWILACSRDLCRPTGAQARACARRPPSGPSLGLAALLRNSLYVSLSGYALVSCGLSTQGGALPLDEAACANELGAKLTLGCSMQPLRGKAAKSKGGLFQQALTPGVSVAGPAALRMPTTSIALFGFAPSHCKVSSRHLWLKSDEAASSFLTGDSSSVGTWLGRRSRKSWCAAETGRWQLTGPVACGSVFSRWRCCVS